MSKKTNMEEECKHRWEEDPMFASGAITVICGDPKNLVRETRLICEKCGAVDYVPTENIGSITDLVNED